MILGIIGLVLCFIVVPSLLALIFGLVAAGQIKRGAGAVTGRGLARAGWIMGIIGLLAGGAFIVAAASGAFEGGETAVFDLERGDCANFDFNPEAGRIIEVSTVDVVDCDEEHEAEVIEVGELNPDEDRDYPSNDELLEESYAACGREDRTNIFPVFPDEDGWNDHGGPFVCFEVVGG
jgi:hypothetical protein